MILQENLICNICNKFLNDPVYLPCHCYVCNKHISSKDNTIKCLRCNEEFPKSKCFKSNQLAKQFIESDSHLTGEQTTKKQSITNMLSQFDALLEEFQSNQANFEINITKQFDNFLCNFCAILNLKHSAHG